MEHKFVVELQSPLFEPQLSRVASQVASELALTEPKLGKLLSRGAGPLTKRVNKPVAEKVAETLRAAGGDAVVVGAVVSAVGAENVWGEAGVRSSLSQDVIYEDVVTPPPLPTITDKARFDPAVSSFSQYPPTSSEAGEEVGSQQPETEKLMAEEGTSKEAEDVTEVATPNVAVTPYTKTKPAKSGPWVVVGSVLMVVVLAVVVYGMWLR